MLIAFVFNRFIKLFGTQNVFLVWKSRLAQNNSLLFSELWNMSFRILLIDFISNFIPNGLILNWKKQNFHDFPNRCFLHISLSKELIIDIPNPLYQWKRSPHWNLSHFGIDNFLNPTHKPMNDPYITKYVTIPSLHSGTICDSTYKSSISVFAKAILVQPMDSLRKVVQELWLFLSG